MSDLEKNVHMHLLCVAETIGEDGKAEQEPVRFAAGIEAMACAPYHLSM